MRGKFAQGFLQSQWGWVIITVATTVVVLLLIILIRGKFEARSIIPIA